MSQFNDPRELRGLKILSEPDTIRNIDKNNWEVRSQSGNGYYQVNRFYKDRHAQMRGQAVWSCTCPDHQTRNVICKHIHAIQFSLKLKVEVEADIKAQKIIGVDDTVICPVCKSENVIKRGIRRTSFGEVQRYGCINCQHRFVVDKGFSKMKHTPETITLTLDLYFKGLSDRKIVDHLKQFHNVSVVHSTIIRWIHKYLKLLRNTLRSIRQKSGIYGIVTKQPYSSKKKETKNITSGSGT